MHKEVFILGWNAICPNGQWFWTVVFGYLQNENM